MCVSALEIWIYHRNTRNPHLRVKNILLLMGQLRSKLQVRIVHNLPPTVCDLPRLKKAGAFFWPQLIRTRNKSRLLVLDVGPVTRAVIE